MRGTWLLVGGVVGLCAFLGAPPTLGEEPALGTIETVAGGGVGDGGNATSASLRNPMDVDMDALGNLYVLDRDNHRVRRIDTDGTITTVAGGGQYDSSEAYGVGPETFPSLSYPMGMVLDGRGNIYIADGHRVRKAAPDGTLTTVAGTGQAGYSGDGGMAALRACGAHDVALDAQGDLLIADSATVGAEGRLRRVHLDPRGRWTPVVRGGGGRVRRHPRGTDGSGRRPCGEHLHPGHQLRPEGLTDGTITTVAGRGPYANTGDGCRDAGKPGRHTGACGGRTGNLYLSAFQGTRVVRASDGTVWTVAGEGGGGTCGDSLETGGRRSRRAWPTRRSAWAVR